MMLVSHRPLDVTHVVAASLWFPQEAAEAYGALLAQRKKETHAAKELAKKRSVSRKLSEKKN